MARPKTYTVETALDQAMVLFRQRGYSGTSMQMISDRLGISRSSIYATFGDKHGLFEQTLRHYGPTCRVPGAERAARCRIAARRAAAAIRVGGRRRRRRPRSVSAHQLRHRTQEQFTGNRGDPPCRVRRSRDASSGGHRTRQDRERDRRRSGSHPHRILPARPLSRPTGPRPLRHQDAGAARRGPAGSLIVAGEKPVSENRPPACHLPQPIA